MQRLSYPKSITKITIRINFFVPSTTFPRDFQHFCKKRRYINYTVRHITAVTAGRLLTAAASPPPIRQVLTDSRQITAPRTSLFVALRGVRYDGHRFLQSAYASGVRCFLVSTAEAARDLPEAHFIVVSDTLEALQTLAAHHRGRFTCPVIGITGSNGKTVVKEWLFQLLRRDFHIIRSPKSYNSQVGVPLSVLAMNESHDLAIFEAGISQPGEMEKLQRIIRPTIGILTNLGAAHDEGFNDREEKLHEKIKLFAEAETVICADKFAAYFADRPALQLLKHGRGAAAHLRLTRVVKSDIGTKIFARLHDQKMRLLLPFPDAASVQNVLSCCLCLSALGIDNQTITERIRNLERVAMRLELKQAAGGSVLINDSYNSDLTSLKIALRFLAQQSKDLRRVVVLSDILQSGKKQQQLYPQVAELAEKYKIDILAAIGTDIRELKPDIPAVRYYDTTADFLADYRPEDFKNAAILVKGARKFAFERIAARLELKTHSAIAEINLNALLHNLRVYRSFLRPTTKVLVMLKASAYGSGSLEIAKFLEYQQADYFGVAYADEGAELRAGGIKTPILVLNPDSATFDQMLRYRLEPEIYSLHQLRELIRFLQTNGGEMQVHLKVETGMNRLGFAEDDLPALCDLLRQTPQIKVLSVFSHLVGTDSADFDSFSAEQVARFDRAYDFICASLGYAPFTHILNSSGISRLSHYQKDMVRLGVGIYGGDNGQNALNLQVVCTLKAVIAQIKTVDPAETVGYNRRGKITRPTRIATVGIGYADGLPRAAGNGNYAVALHGQRASIVGVVCMDMCMIDVTDIAEAREGDSVVIFGEEPAAEELAAACGTIVYEIFTGISGRVKRVYTEE